MANYRDGYEVKGAPTGLASKVVYLTADDTAVTTADVSLILIGSDNTTATNRTFTLATSSLVGHELLLVWNTGSSSTGQLVDTGTAKLTADWTPGQYDTLKLVSDGTNWLEVARGVASGVTDIPLAENHVLVGNSSGLAADVAVSGDISITSAGVTAIASGVVVNADVKSDAAIDYSKLAALASARLLVGSAGNVATAVDVTGDVTISNAGVTAIGAAKVTEAMLKAPDTVGLGAKRTCYAVFDPTAVSGDRTIAAHALGTAIPDDAFVTGFWYWVETTCTSATDAATIALHIQAANDCVSAIAINDGTNPWDTTALPVEGVPKLETTSTWLATTAARQMTATVAVETLTGGKVHMWAEYFAY